MYRYYKISQEWAERLGETQTAVKHPDGMYLVTPNLGPRIAEELAKDNGGYRPLPAEAFAAIGAIGLTVAEAQASAKGELRHDNVNSADNSDNAEDLRLKTEDSTLKTED
ncbi:MAG: hypothetical protein K2H72_08460 [Muribaculaceae bacterium]|nr:hypothetical protein [Muribaculaceae bacterium]